VSHRQSAESAIASWRDASGLASTLLFLPLAVMLLIVVADSQEPIIMQPIGGFRLPVYSPGSIEALIAVGLGLLLLSAGASVARVSGAVGRRVASWLLVAAVMFVVEFLAANRGTALSVHLDPWSVWSTEPPLAIAAFVVFQAMLASGTGAVTARVGLGPSRPAGGWSGRIGWLAGLAGMCLVIAAFALWLKGPEVWYHGWVIGASSQGFGEWFPGIIGSMGMLLLVALWAGFPRASTTPMSPVTEAADAPPSDLVRL